MNHDLYKTGDADVPDQIKDRNGEVVLAMCKKCGRAEIELDQECEYVYIVVDESRLLSEVANKSERADLDAKHWRDWLES